MPVHSITSSLRQRDGDDVSRRRVIRKHNTSRSQHICLLGLINRLSYAVMVKELLTTKENEREEG
jgi:hypothetical protein